MSKDAVRTILFISQHNAVRGPIAEAMAKRMFGPGARILSAGTRPTQIDPRVAVVLQEIGIQLEKQEATSLALISPHIVDLVICLGQPDLVPDSFARSGILHWALPEVGEGERLEELRAVRDALVRQLTLLGRVLE